MREWGPPVSPEGGLTWSSSLKAATVGVGLRRMGHGWPLRWHSSGPQTGEGQSVGVRGHRRPSRGEAGARLRRQVGPGSVARSRASRRSPPRRGPGAAAWRAVGLAGSRPPLSRGPRAERRVPGGGCRAAEAEPVGAGGGQTWPPGPAADLLWRRGEAGARLSGRLELGASGVLPGQGRGGGRLRPPPRAPWSWGPWAQQPGGSDGPLPLQAS